MNEWLYLLETHLKNIIEEKVQGQTPCSELIWVLFLTKHGIKYTIINLFIFWNFLYNCSI